MATKLWEEIIVAIRPGVVQGLAPPDDLRDLVEDAINDHLDQEQLQILKVAEESGCE